MDEPVRTPHGRSAPGGAHAGDGERLARISTGMVQLLRGAVGKGPTRCKTHWAGADMLVVVLGGGFLASEQTLLDAGRGDDVRANRRVMQEVLEAPMRELVEDQIGRRVVAFMSAQHQDPDLQVEIFVLEPAGDEPVV